MGTIMNFLSGLAYVATEPNFIGKLVQWLFEAIGGTGKYWLTVILFTLFLKLATSPLDYWQRLTGKKNAAKLEKLKPQLDALQKKYGDDKNALTMKQNELYKAAGYSPLGACLPMIVMMVIMIVMFTGLNTFATYKQVQEFNALKDEYYYAVQAYVDDYFADKSITAPEIENVSDAVREFENWYLAGNPEPDKVTEFEDWKVWQAEYYTAWCEFTDELINTASTAVMAYHKDHRESFIWIKNIWRSDTFWTTPVPSAADFKGLLPSSQKAVFDELEYENVMQEIESSMGTANGYLILPLLAMVLMFFSSKITSKTQQTGMPQNDQMQQQNKMMQWMMPIMMGVFGLMYTSAVALYMIMNSIFTVLLSFPINWIVGLRMNKINEKNGSRPGYRR